MSSTGIILSNLTPNNLGFKAARELLFSTVFVDSALANMCTIKTGLRTGEFVGYIDRFPEVGTPRTAACGGTWNANQANTIQKQWEILRYEVMENICEDDIKDSLLRFEAETGTDYQDITTSQYMGYIVQPLLEDALQRLTIRLGWFGDKSASNVTGGGEITDGVNVDLFKTCDGLWKKIFAITAANAKQRVTIAANAEATYELQESKIREAGVATGIIRDLITKAPKSLRANKKAFIQMTMSLKDALDDDIVVNNKGSELQWKAIAGGIMETNFRGVKLQANPEWDERIQAFHDTGTKWINPHRAIYADKANLLIGSEEKKEVADLNVWYEKKDHKVYMEAFGTLGSLVAEDKQMQVAH